MTAQTIGIIQARRADTSRRRDRVLKALDAATEAREEISVSAIARRAGVDRTFLYRHRDLLDMIHTQAAEPPPITGETVSRPSLLADLANAQDRNTRLAKENQQLRGRLSAALGEEIWREAGLGAPPDVETLTGRITELEQEAVELRRRLQESEEDLEAARSVNREYMARLNASDTTPGPRPAPPGIALHLDRGGRSDGHP
jgi:transposase-like protein